MIHAPCSFAAFEMPDRALRRARDAHAVKVKVTVAIAIIKNQRARAIGSTAVQALHVGAAPRDRAHAIAKMERMPDKRFRRKYRMTRASFAKLCSRRSGLPSTRSAQAGFSPSTRSCPSACCSR